MFRASMCERNRSASDGRVCSISSIWGFSTTSTVLALSAMAVAMRRGCPARHPSPKKSPGPRIATTASLLSRDSTESLTLPSCR
ncbi:MAG: hypothetical protein A3F70_08585 [Acidobacteria bacterium RIFCSPLOWO2_12_FULL_67_14]|nr:MAG: hypothetical protein A3H29_13795 [Acidobacteria bacterium RIFCSPLOWO2_02_FULL_67_21]OFW41567.1 MAG: hypothetical protein A3F70_08585 [Acidobacteria bacterium RIFCSPLOWO2_12_FULL_67_14]